MTKNYCLSMFNVPLILPSKCCLKFELEIDYVSYQHTLAYSKTATFRVGGGGAGALGSLQIKGWLLATIQTLLSKLNSQIPEDQNSSPLKGSQKGSF